MWNQFVPCHHKTVAMIDNKLCNNNSVFDKSCVDFFGPNNDDSLRHLSITDFFFSLFLLGTSKILFFSVGEILGRGEGGSRGERCEMTWWGREVDEKIRSEKKCSFLDECRLQHNFTYESSVILIFSLSQGFDRNQTNISLIWVPIKTR